MNAERRTEFAEYTRAVAADGLGSSAAEAIRTRNVADPEFAMLTLLADFALKKFDEMGVGREPRDRPAACG